MKAKPKLRANSGTRTTGNASFTAEITPTNNRPSNLDRISLYDTLSRDASEADTKSDSTRFESFVTRAKKLSNRRNENFFGRSEMKIEILTLNFPRETMAEIKSAGPRCRARDLLIITTYVKGLTSLSSVYPATPNKNIDFTPCPACHVISVNGPVI